MNGAYKVIRPSKKKASPDDIWHFDLSTIDAIKLDRGEEFIPNQPDDVWFDGRTGREVHNEFQLLQARTFHDALDLGTGGDFVLMGRAGYSGSQHWSSHWGGDARGDYDLGLRAAPTRFGPGRPGYATPAIPPPPGRTPPGSRRRRGGRHPDRGTAQIPLPPGAGPALPRGPPTGRTR